MAKPTPIEHLRNVNCANHFELEPTLARLVSFELLFV